MQVNEAIMSAETRLRDTFEQDVGHELNVADAAATLLMTVAGSVGERTGRIDVDANGVPTGGDVAMLQLFAMQLMGMRAFRVVRAARAVLECGYEAESRSNDRILVELLEHRRAILEDSSGAETKAWIEGSRSHGIGKRVAEQSPEDLYFNLCMDSHGDPRPIARLQDPETGEINAEPKRTPATRASLLMHAGFARDMAVVIAGLAALELGGVDELDAAINDGWARLEADAG